MAGTAVIEDVARPGQRQHWVAQTDRHAREKANEVATRFEGRSQTWPELAERTRRLAGWLRAAGVGPGDRVATALGNRPEFIEIMIATSRLGAITVPMNFRLTEREIAFILSDSQSSVVVSDASTVQAVTATGLLDAAHHVHVGAGAVPGTTPYAEAAAADVPDEDSFPDVPEHHPALIMYTSGTTGRPKGAVLTYRNMAAQCTTLITAFGMQANGEVNMVALPLFHIGAIGSVAPSLLLGATLVIVPSGAFVAGRIIELIEVEGVTSLFLVPEQWQQVCAELERRPRELATLRVTGWGAAPASEALLRRMEAAFPNADIVALFGQTELSGVSCVLEGRDAIRKRHTVGKAAPQVSIRIVDEQMNDVEQGQVGEIVYRGPAVLSHYWNAPEATAEAFAGGWFHSGDLVSVDEEGFVQVRDRKKDMLISGGENIYCVEVEHVLARHPDVLEVSVIGRAHPKWGQTPVAIVVPKPDRKAPAVEDLREWAGNHLARYKLPTSIEVLEALPRNATGKVNKHQLRELFGGGAS
jgi:fatty-acyl-CoA synthase